MRHCILIALLASGLLAGCGQKGPLYLPEALPEADTSSAAASPGVDQGDSPAPSGRDDTLPDTGSAP